ncbi:MAG: MATE family efflux transporter [Pseudomonas sp.]|nr:MATE family efflux transporter [Pseudomonas sp.]
MKSPTCAALARTSMLIKFFTVLCVRSLGALSIFGLNFLVVKKLLPAEAGAFLWMYSALMIGVQFSIMGLHDVSLKYIAQKKGVEDWASINGISRKILHWVSMACAVTSVLFYGIAAPVAHWFFPGQDNAVQVFQVMAPSVLFLGVATVLSYQLQAVQQPLKSVFVLSIGAQLFFCIVFVALDISAPVDAGLAYTASCLANLCVALFWWFRLPPHNELGAVEGGALWHMALPMWGIAIMSVTVNWGGQFLSALWIPADQVAGYAVALRIAALINFLLIAMNFIVAPRIAQLHSRHQHAELQQLITQSMRLLYLLATPIVIGVVIFAGPLMSLFGSQFVAGTQILIILALGQLINVATGPVGYLLTMTGHETAMRNMYVLSGLACISLVCVLTPLFGVAGAAWATAISTAVQNLGAAWLTATRLNISVSPFGARYPVAT